MNPLTSGFDVSVVHNVPMGLAPGRAQDSWGSAVIHVPLPLFVLRRLVRKNPWLLSEQGTVRRALVVTLGPLELEIQSEAVLTPRQKARLQVEAAAGVLGPGPGRDDAADPPA